MIRQHRESASEIPKSLASDDFWTVVDRMDYLDAREVTFDPGGHRARVHLVARKAQPRRPAPRKDHAERACRSKGVSPRADLRRKR